MLSLFKLGKFKLHSGGESRWKIDCDALTGEDLAALAAIAADQLGPERPFREVVGIPSGGLRFADAMRRYADPGACSVLVVDDVLTTGKSVREMRDQILAQRVGVEVFGLVIFARTAVEPWVERIFQMKCVGS